MKKDNTQSAISILHGIRKRAEERIKHYKVVSYTLICLLFIDFAIVLVAPLKTVISIFGILIIIGWITFSFIALIEQKKEQKEIDEFYLELSKQTEDEIEKELEIKEAG